jgi:NAD-dependent DNA ligase
MVGSIVNITIERNTSEEMKQLQEFNQLQNEIYQDFSTSPKAPHITIKGITQTSCIVEWEPIDLSSSTFKAIEVYRSGVNLSIKTDASTTKLKLTGLSVATRYEFQILLKTTAGSFYSNKVELETHTMENLSGLYPCFGAFSNEADIDNLIEMLDKMGAMHSDGLSADNTHLICNLAKGPKYERAMELNIPIVTPEFLKACETSGTILPVNTFYLEKHSS